MSQSEGQQVGVIPTEGHRLVAVVVTHNRPDQLGVTLGRLLQVPAGALEALVVVDNASGAETQQLLAGQSDLRLVVLRSDENLGGAGGFDLGMREAMRRFRPDWVVVMDDDARPMPGTLEAFARADHQGRDAVAAAVYYPDGRICEMNRPSRNPFRTARIFLKTLFGGGRDGYHIAPAAYQGVAQPIDIASFVGLFISRRAIEATGFPDPSLFLYGDDVIYCLRMRRAGMAIDFDPALPFEHDCSTFQNDARRVFNPLWKTYYSYRNGLIMYHEAAGLLFWPLLLVVVPKWLLASRRYGDDRGAYLQLTRMAIRHALTRARRPDHRELVALTEKLKG